jgi:hypothetical protein
MRSGHESALRSSPWRLPSVAATVLLALAGCARYVAEPYETAVPEAEATTTKKQPERSPTAAEKAATPVRTVVRYIKVAEPVKVSNDLLKKIEAPACDISSADVLGNAEAQGATPDPNLIEIARLELVRDCFKKAEVSAREKLHTLQSELRGK